MSAPAVIDTLEFARSGERLGGILPVASLKRLEDILYDTTGELEYEIRGTRDSRRREQLQLSVSGTLRLQCQRCLGQFDYTLGVASVLALVARGARPDTDLDELEAPDAIEASAELEVAGLIEDEVLLALPLAPRHAEGTCARRLGEQPTGAGPAPAFAQLAVLARARNKY